jgi:hypothetical protein
MRLSGRRCDDAMRAHQTRRLVLLSACTSAHTRQKSFFASSADFPWRRVRAGDAGDSATVADPTLHNKTNEQGEGWGGERRTPAGPVAAASYLEFVPLVPSLAAVEIQPTVRGPHRLFRVAVALRHLAHARCGSQPPYPIYTTRPAVVIPRFAPASPPWLVPLWRVGGAGRRGGDGGYTGVTEPCDEARRGGWRLYLSFDRS